MQEKKGLVLLYTGNGKGKTTASLGLALRAVGHGKKVFMIQFMKDNENYGEVQAIRKYLRNFELVQSGLDTFVKKGNPSSEDIRLAREGLDLARKIILEGQHDMVILDEINVAVDYGLVSEEDVLNLISVRPEHVTIVLTGRYASQKIMEKADMVSDVQEIKHHWQKGIPAQAGIEY